MAGLFGDDTPDAAPAQAPGAPAAYRVLARKYRPKTFGDLIGQEALVRTLRNAFAMNRLAHAFMLTGVRGVGKTTTARILARAVNCTGADGGGGPTPDPCGVCDNCVSILADRHPDVVEMDAASNTGIDDVREIIEATRFRPMIARTKFFIIDEVHMLSRQAFNALLKTLEEPPPHIKFVLATTEIRKVPVTVLSRCQRFDLRRVAIDELSALFDRIAVAESATLAPEALALIARAADGSVRDGLSLLDQAIARGENGAIDAPAVIDMLGLADRFRVYDLLDAIIAGDTRAALGVMDEAYQVGADPGVMLTDLLNVTHLLTRIKTVPALAAEGGLPETERARGAALAGALSIPWLGRMWQMLLKGVQEVEMAPDRRAAAEMITIRLCHVADMPPPAELIQRITGAAVAGATVAGAAGAPPAPRPTGGARAVANGAAINAAVVSAGVVNAAVVNGAVAAAAAPVPTEFSEIVGLAHARRDVRLYADLRHYAHPVRLAAPVLELRLEPDAPRDLLQRLATLLESETSHRWTIALSHAPGEATLEQREQAAETEARAAAAAHPLVREILRVFPGARLNVAQADGPARPAAPAWDAPPDHVTMEEEQE